MDDVQRIVTSMNEFVQVRGKHTVGVRASIRSVPASLHLLLHLPWHGVRAQMIMGSHTSHTSHK